MACLSLNDLFNYEVSFKEHKLGTCVAFKTFLKRAVESYLKKHEEAVDNSSSCLSPNVRTPASWKAVRAGMRDAGITFSENESENYSPFSERPLEERRQLVAHMKQLTEIVKRMSDSEIEEILREEAYNTIQALESYMELYTREQGHQASEEARSVMKRIKTKQNSMKDGNKVALFAQGERVVLE